MLPRLLLLLALLAACAPAPPRLSGTVLEASPAPDFTLTDGQTGERVSLSSLRGSVVALAFLYTRCPDVCPLTAANYRAAQRELGADASRVRFVAVSVDPDGDTREAVREFSARHDLSAGWHYLIGTADELREVWGRYGIGAVRAPAGPAVTHNDAIYLIDPAGREREIVHVDTPVADLVADIRTLLRGG